MSPAGTPVLAPRWGWWSWGWTPGTGPQEWPGNECHPSPLGTSPLLEVLPGSRGRSLCCGNHESTRRLNEHRLLILWELLSILWELLLIQLVLLLIRLEQITTRWRSGALSCKQREKRTRKFSLSPPFGICLYISLMHLLIYLFYSSSLILYNI